MTTAEEAVREVACSRCRAKVGQPRVGDYYGQGEDFNTPHGGLLDEPHPERIERAEGFADRPRWPCRKEGCDGSRKAIVVSEALDEMLSSTEGACPECGWWIEDPADCITSDELLRDLAPTLVETHELVDNPKGPKTKLAASEAPNLTLADWPSNPEAVMHIVPRTKPPEWNPLRSVLYREGAGR